MSDRLDRIASGLMTIAAILVAATVVHREFFPPKQRVSTPLGPPEFVSKWREAADVGIELGNPAAKVKVVEFSDLECPFCKSFHTAVQNVMKAHPGDVSLVFVHYPGASHRFAMQAAQAVECASDRGRVAQLVDIVFTNQDSLGMKSWGSYASDAGISDTAAFRQCVQSKTPAKRIAAGRSAGQKIGVGGTPTVIINGWRFSRPPSEEELGAAVDSLLIGHPLRDTTSRSGRAQ